MCVEYILRIVTARWSGVEVLTRAYVHCLFAKQTPIPFPKVSSLHSFISTSPRVGCLFVCSRFSAGCDAVALFHLFLQLRRDAGAEAALWTSRQHVSSRRSLPASLEVVLVRFVLFFDGECNNFLCSLLAHSM